MPLFRCGCPAQRTPGFESDGRAKGWMQACIVRASCVSVLLTFFPSSDRSHAARTDPSSCNETLRTLPGCSIPGVVEDVCGQETCTPGPVGYTCGKRAKAPPNIVSDDAPGFLLRRLASRLCKMMSPKMEEIHGLPKLSLLRTYSGVSKNLDISGCPWCILILLVFGEFQPFL